MFGTLGMESDRIFGASSLCRRHPEPDTIIGNGLTTMKRKALWRTTAVGVLFTLIGLCLAASACAAVPDLRGKDNVAHFRPIVEEASAPSPPWAGPITGPTGVTGKKIALIAEDLRNGGILGVAQGIGEAARVLRWHVQVFDAGGTPTGRAQAVAESLAIHPDGMILVGADASEMATQLKPFADRGIPVVGWHVGPTAGPLTGSPVAGNVSTDPLEVARVTAMAAVVDSGGHAGVVIFTDSNFRIAMAKAKAMADVIRSCQGCDLLEVRDVAISKSSESMSGIIRELLSRHGSRWTHALAINDIYFDYAVPELTKVGRSPDSLKLLSAGDGSAAAFLRIQAGLYQIGTVAEPLNLHGWQLVDELNRLFAHCPLNGHVVPVHLVTPANIVYDGGSRLQYDPDNEYREIYQGIWGKK